jgi:hypothetical protein
MTQQCDSMSETSLTAATRARGVADPSIPRCINDNIDHGNSTVPPAATVLPIFHVSIARDTADSQRANPSSICHAHVAFVTLKHQMNAGVPSLLHPIKSKLDTHLDLLGALSRTWPIAAMFSELFQTMVNEDQFNRTLSLAVGNCRKRANGDESDTDRSRPAKKFRKAKTEQVMLPENRVAIQVSQRGTRTHMQLPCSHSPALTDQRLENATPGIEDPGEPDASSADLDDLGFSWDNTDPSTILQNIREFARTGELAATRTSDFG